MPPNLAAPGLAAVPSACSLTCQGRTRTVKKPWATLRSSSVASLVASAIAAGPGTRRIVMPSPSASTSGPAATR
jgi:hypothetical protein